MSKPRVPGFYLPRIVTTSVVCSGCGVHLIHVEVMDGDDEPDGVPDWLTCDDCGSQLLPDLDLESET